MYYSCLPFYIITLIIERVMEVIFITDIAKAGSKPETALWKFDTLKENIKSGKINILRFNLLDVEVYFLNLIRDCTLVNDSRCCIYL